MRKTKIAVIGLKGLPAFGGAATVGENIIRELCNDFEFTVLSVSSHTSINNTEINGVRQIIFNNHGKGGLNTFLYYLKCMFYVLFNKFDLIHLHHGSSGFITPFLRLKYNVILTFHGVHRDKDDPKFSALQNLFIRFSQKLNIKFSSTLVSVSKPDKKYLENRFRRSVIYIPNGINIHQTKKKAEKNYLSFAAGRIYQIKGLHYLLESIHKLKDKIPLVVAGDINQVQNYKDKIFELSRGLDVNFLGLLKDKNQLLDEIRNSRLFIFQSVTESMSFKLIDVVSTKTTIISSVIPANNELFSDEEILFFKSEDSNDLSLKLEFALANEDIMKSKAKLAFEKLEKEYVWKRISDEYLKIFNNN